MLAPPTCRELKCSKKKAFEYGGGGSDSYLAVFFLVFCGSKLAGEYVTAFDITRKAYRIAHNGQIDTDLQFSEFFGDSYTLTAWVMPEFTYNWDGAIFGETVASRNQGTRCWR
jgi:hypothetical protein